MNESDVIGQRGRIIGDHPWSGRIGAIAEVVDELLGYSAIVRLDQQAEGVGRGAAVDVFVFDLHRNWAQLEEDAK